MPELSRTVAAAVGPRSSFEEALFECIVDNDEYGLAGRQFAPTDVIIDIGAHIGIFSAACHALGSRMVFAFEPNPETFRRLSALADRTEGITADPRAVWRSDGTGEDHGLVVSGGIGSNSGSSNVIFGGCPFDVDNQVLAGLNGGTEPVVVVALDDVLASFARVTLLKIDCEGSEYPILLTSRLLSRVDEIVGEYHLVGAEVIDEVALAARLGGLTSFRPEMLTVALTTRGFEVTLTPYNARIGWFRAVRRAAAST